MLAPLLDGRGEGVESQMAPVSKMSEGLRGLGRQLCGAGWQSWLAGLAVLGKLHSVGSRGSAWQRVQGNVCKAIVSAAD